MAGEEPGKMPELYVEALLEEHGLGKRPQAAMRSKCKRVRNLLPTPPELASELRRQLELPENVETWMQAYEHLQSTMDERACAYEALLCQAKKKARRAQHWLDSERKRFREDIRAMQSTQDCYMAAQETLLIRQRTLERKYRRLLRDYDDVSREYKDARNALNALTNTPDGAEMVMQLHLGEQIVSRIPQQYRDMIGQSVEAAYDAMEEDAEHSGTSTPERV